MNGEQHHYLPWFVNEFIDRKQRGEHPTIKKYCIKHPDLAQDIREVLPTIKMIEDLKPKVE